MLVAFKICFFVGVGITALSAILSIFFGIIDFDVDFDIDLDIGDFDLGAFLPVSPSLMFMFLAVFGGTGWALTGHLAMPLIVVIALLLGMLAVQLVNRLVVRPLKKISEIEAGADSDYIGMPAKISEKIFTNEYGKITFFYDGNTVTAPAKSINGEAIDCGTEVLIMSIENQTYMVERVDAAIAKQGL